MPLTIFQRPKIILSLFIFGFFICGLSSVPSFAAEERVGFIDIQKAVSNTKEWKTSFNKFKLNFTAVKEKIKVREEKIKNMQEELNKQSFVLDPELKRGKEEQLRKEKITFERYVQDQNAELSKKEKEVTQKILRKMMDIVKKLGAEGSYAMILGQQSVLYHDASNDLTEVATTTYDRENE